MKVRKDYTAVLELWLQLDNKVVCEGYMQFFGLILMQERRQFVGLESHGSMMMRYFLFLIPIKLKFKL